MESRAYKIFTSEGSSFTARFDPRVEVDGVLYGKIVVMGYSQVAEKNLKIVGISSEPEPGGRMLIEQRPWSIEVVENEEVPLYEYENISAVQDITHLLGELHESIEETPPEDLDPTLGP